MTSPIAPPSSASVGMVHELLGALIRSEAFERGDVATAVAHMTEAASNALGVERASVWRATADGGVLACVDVFERSSARHATAPPPSSGPCSTLEAPIVVASSRAGVLRCEDVEGRAWTPWEELVAGTFADLAVLLFGAEQRSRHARALAAHRARLEQLVEERTRQLRESEEAFRKLFEAAPVALVLSRLPDNHVIAANARCAEIFELGTAAAVLGEHAPDYWIEPGERRRLVELVRERGTVDDYLARMRTHEGREFWADIAVRLVTMGGERSLLFSVRDVTVQKELEARLVELATIDELTGALNRRRLFEVATSEVERAKRYDRPLSVAMFDLDEFKRINDEHGHAAGDETLRRVGAAMRSLVRKQDEVGRYGGEELMIVFPETGLADSSVVAERTRAAIEALDIVHAGEPLRVTASVGVVEWQPGEDLASLIRRADEALYAAKAAGRNRVLAR